MKVLLLSYNFPPDRAVGGQRARNVIEVLRAAGHDVTVIAAGDSEAQQADSNWIRPIPSIRELYVRLKTKYRSPEQPSGSSIEPATNKMEGGPSDVACWKRWIFSLIWLPDDKQRFILPAVWKAVGLHGGRPDFIYTTAPPFSVHLSGMILKVLTCAR